MEKANLEMNVKSIFEACVYKKVLPFFSAVLGALGLNVCKNMTNKIVPTKFRCGEWVSKKAELNDVFKSVEKFELSTHSKK